MFGMNKNHIKAKIFKLIEDNWEELSPHKDFSPGKDFIQYSGAVFDQKEINAALDILLDGWFGIDKKAVDFEKKIAEYFGVSHGVVVNSGSSANLIAVSALKSLKMDNPLKDGDEIITPFAGFPTTVNPIIQNGLIPVFVDVELGSYNIDISKIEAAISPRTRAIVVVHTLGNPVDMKAVMEIARRNQLYVIEDCCDALGSEIHGQKVGSFGDIATCSFYPAHHITMGEGGIAVTSDKNLSIVMRSLREWGKACYCYGKGSVNMKDGFCNKRFSKWLPDLDEIVDHKYVYSEIGYNLKPLELQCAMGLEQLKKLQDFIDKRNRNFQRLYEFFKNFETFFILPSWHETAEPSWFGFPLTIRHDAPFNRFDIINYMEDNKIQTRNLFAGNILFHPAYKKINCRKYGSSINSDIVTTNTFFLGVYPAIDKNRMDYILEKLSSFFESI